MKKTTATNTTLTTREFIRNFSRLIQKPKSRTYTIVKHGKSIATVIPHQNDEEWWQNIHPENYWEASRTKRKKKRYTLEELREKYSFHSGEKNLSQKIDEIVYGVKFH